MQVLLSHSVLAYTLKKYQKTIRIKHLQTIWYIHYIHYIHSIYYVHLKSGFWVKKVIPNLVHRARLGHACLDIGRRSRALFWPPPASSLQSSILACLWITIGHELFSRGFADEDKLLQRIRGLSCKDLSQAMPFVLKARERSLANLIYHYRCKQGLVWQNPTQLWNRYQMVNGSPRVGHNLILLPSSM